MFSALSSENSYFLSAKRRLRKLLIFSYLSVSSENSYALAALSAVLVLLVAAKIAVATAGIAGTVVELDGGSTVDVRLDVLMMVRLDLWLRSRTRFEGVLPSDVEAAARAPEPIPLEMQDICSSSRYLFGTYLGLSIRGSFSWLGYSEVSHSAKSAIIWATIFREFVASQPFWADFLPSVCGSSGCMASKTSDFVVLASLLSSDSKATEFLSQLLIYEMSILFEHAFSGLFWSNRTFSMWIRPLVNMMMRSGHRKFKCGSNLGSDSDVVYFV